MLTKTQRRLCITVIIILLYLIGAFLWMHPQSITVMQLAMNTIMSSQNDRYWDMYSLGDTVKSRDNTDKGWAIHSKKHNLKNKNSIAAQYILRTNKSNDYEVLMDIVNEKMRLKNDSSQIPNANDLIIHLRTGDVIDRSDKSVDEMLNSTTDIKFACCVYVKPMSFFKRVMEFAKNKNLTNVVFVTGFHKSLPKSLKSLKAAYFGNHKGKSLDYLDRLKNEFEKNNFQTLLLLNQNPDDDFIYMSNSRYFVQSGGGFSELIGKMVEMRNGTVFHFND